MKAATLEADGYALCPDCKTRIHCGSVGIANLEKNHCGKKTCIKARQKHEKEQQAAKRPNLLTFFNKPKASLVPSTIPHSAPIQGLHSAPVAASGFLEKLHHLIESLLNTILEASDDNKLAIFEGNPMDFDDPTLDADSLWETVLNAQLKSVLGWGMEEDLDLIIWRGEKGLDGLANFVEYFVVKRGVKEGLFEGKLSHLMTALQTL